MVPRVFVSHAHKDDDFTKRFVDNLRAAGATVWVDFVDINAGDFLKRISDGLRQCDWCVLVLTQNALDSTAVEMEVNAALEMVRQGQMRGVIPFVAGPYDPQRMPPLWRPLHRYDATSNYQAAFAGLMHAVGILIPAPAVAPSRVYTARSYPAIPPPPVPNAAIAAASPRTPYSYGPAIGVVQPVNQSVSPPFTAGRLITVAVAALAFNSVASLNDYIPLIPFPFLHGRGLGPAIAVSGACVFYLALLLLPSMRWRRASVICLLSGFPLVTLIALSRVLAYSTAFGGHVDFPSVLASTLGRTVPAALFFIAAMTGIAAGAARWRDVRLQWSPRSIRADMVLLVLTGFGEIVLSLYLGHFRYSTDIEAIDGLISLAIFATACWQTLRRLRAARAGVASS